MKRCVNAHDRCYGGAGAPCPYCEGYDPPRDKRGRFARATESLPKGTEEQSRIPAFADDGKSQ